MEKINWLEWSEEAFEKAKREDKPILLDIYGVWCHWCHVQDESYSDPIVIELVNEKFVPIKVDTDKRPDINERYNQGGWPTTAFLTPDGALISGATYVPPAELASMLEQISHYYARNKVPIVEMREIKPDKGKLKSVIKDVADELIISFDADYGGFGSQPKFPFPDAIELALFIYQISGDKTLLKLATKTLDGMIGIFDSVAGGFYRYSVTRDWSLPHYEKMLESNSQLIVNYLHAHLLTGNQKYAETAIKAAEYLLNTLHGPEGFYGSQDADGEDEFYGKPLEERNRLPQPFIDKNIYVSLNAIAIQAFLRLGMLDERYKKIAIDTLDVLIGKCWGDRGVCHYYDSRQNVFGLFADNIQFVMALLDAYETTSMSKYLDKARALMGFLLENFFDGSFVDRKDNDNTGLLALQNRNINDNSVAASCLMHLAFLTGDSKYTEYASDALSSFAKNYSRYGLHGALYATTVEKFLERIEIIVPDKKQAALVRSLHDPRIMVKTDPSENKISICRKEKCMRFDDLEKAKEFLVAK